MTPANASDASDFTAVILAGRRAAGDPVAAARGEAYKALVPVLGKPMLLRVVEALGAARRVSQIVIVREDALGPVETAPEFAAAACGKPLAASRAEASIGASLYAAIAARPDETRWLVTTADHALLSPETADAFLEEVSRRKGAIVAFVDKCAIAAAHPGMKRTYFKFRDAAVSAANLYAINGLAGVNAIRFWMQPESRRKRPLRLALTFGFVNLICFYLKLYTLEQAFARISRAVKCPAHAVLLDDPEAAIDVDTLADLETAETILAARGRG